jgi:hypothetical protein
MMSHALLQVVSKEEASAKAEAAKVQAIKDECESDLAEAMPALEAALKALDTLTKNDITEVKGMKSPPASEHRVQPSSTLCVVCTDSCWGVPFTALHTCLTPTHVLS